jgi:hypothetical protein
MFRESAEQSSPRSSREREGDSAESEWFGTDSLPGTSPERERAKAGSSPDVAPDGSIVRGGSDNNNEGTAAQNQTDNGLLTSIVATVAWSVKVLVLLAIITGVAALPVVIAFPGLVPSGTR